MQLRPLIAKRGAVRRQRGGAMMEMALLMPWVFFLFIGALDWGFYAYSLISMQAALRTATLYTSKDSTTMADAATACTLVTLELKNLPNVTYNNCTTNPVVTAAHVTGPDSQHASQVTVTYQTPSMIPIPGMLAKQFTITRTGTMRLRAYP
jgi:Flp pilus assembly protein TadG